MEPRPAILEVLLAQVPTALVFEKGDLNLNIIIERRLPGTPDLYDDRLHLVYRQRGQWFAPFFPCTADPGKDGLVAHENVNGTAIRQPGQCRGSHTIGLHNGSPALVMVSKLPTDPSCIRVWRDRNDDGKIDRTGKTYFDARGLNIHHAGQTPKSGVPHVGPWSLGCTGVLRPGWDLAWSIILDASRVWGPTFTTSLVETQQ
jgi:hypothetical protein